MIESSELDFWVRGLDEARAGRALLALGRVPTPLVDPRSYGKVRTAQIIDWSLDRTRFEADSAQPASQLTRRAPRRFSRVAVSGEVAGADIVARLRHVPAVLSAFIAVERPPGSLRRRPWRWPLRIGLLGFDSGEASKLAADIVQGGRLPERLVDVRRLEDEPAAVDLLVTRLGLGEATSAVLETGTLANTVLVAGEPSGRWAVVEGQLATVRAATGAIATALVPRASLAEALGRLVREMSHGSPLDIAIALAWSGGGLLWAEPQALNRSVLPEVSLRLAREARAADSVLATGAPPEAPAAAMTLDRLSREEFTGEQHEATEVARVGRELDEALESVADERWLQALVNEGRAEAINRLVHGDNDVLIFVGPLEESALAAAPFDESELPWEEEEAEAFRLTVLLVPLEPLGEPRSAEMELPRFGRSRSARFVLTVPKDASEVSARILVLFRNRILQTAVLTGSIGETAELRAQAALVPGFGGLDERRGFDLALLANHDTQGVPGLISHSSPHTWVHSGDGALSAIAERIANKLVCAADLGLRTRLKSKSARELLVALAVHGRDLYNELNTNGRLGSLAEANAIQVVTAGGGWFLPIELAYERDAPNPGAAICERFLADPKTCGGRSCPSAILDFVCPNAFWGLSKTIERHRFDPELGDRTKLVGVPHANRRVLSLEHSLLAASKRVKPGEVGKTRNTLGAGAKTVTSWEEWEQALKNADTRLLVLLPHTNYADPSLEISTKTLVRGRIEERHVTGGRQVEPVLLLLGCRTVGHRGDPGGFASRFMSKKAAVVFHSLTDLKAGHAAQMAQRLAALLLLPARERRSLSDLLTEFRRTAVGEGLLAALAISAYGDADWRI